jgi:predicted house-cleaning noncanonical NTP pyrophosphatase (MazG superfamily)
MKLAQNGETETVKVRYAKQGTQIVSRGEEEDDYSISAQIILAPEDERDQFIRVNYRIYRNLLWEDGAPLYFLECSGNPTTVLAGNNVLPITTRLRTGADEPLPSSSKQTMLTVNRVLFELLAVLNEKLNDCSLNEGFDFRENGKIRYEGFELVRTQFCCYLPTPDVQKFLQLVTLLYAPLVTEAGGIISLSEHLGLKVKHFTDKNHRVTGIQFQWRHGKKLVTSLVFYDKDRRIKQMRQGQTLSVEEALLIQNNIRFDITLHKRGIEQFVGSAKTELEKKRAITPNFLEDLPAKAFLEGKPKPTLWWFERAVIVHSSSVSDGKVTRTSFANWLVERALGDMLRLTSIVKCTPAALHAFADLDEPVVKAWRQADKFEAGKWSKHIVEISSLEKSAVYEHRKRLLKAHGIDIAIPYPFYRDMEHHGPKSLTAPENREAMNQALGKINGKQEVWRLLQQDITNFFDQLVEVVGATVSSPPTHLPMNVVGKKPAGKARATAAPASKPAAKKGAAIALSGTKRAKPTAAEAQEIKAIIQSISMPRNWKSGKPTLPEGIDGRSSNEKLTASRREARKLLQQTLPEKVSEYLEHRIEELESLIERRKGIVNSAKVSRRENKVAGRNKRLGGPLPVKQRSGHLAYHKSEIEG